jgi:hypothetical protein
MHLARAARHRVGGRGACTQDCFFFLLRRRNGTPSACAAAHAGERQAGACLPRAIDEEDAPTAIEQIGLDLNRFDREMAGGAYSAQILDHYYNSLTNGITGVPTTFINGEMVAMSGVELLSVVKTILEKNHSSRTALP